MFRPQDDFMYMMPIHFGGGKFDPESKISQKGRSLIITYETDKALLENYIPEGFELLAPTVEVVFCKFTEINWMHGGQYNLINVSSPVRFHGKKDTLDGAYTLAVWENKTPPISGGREQTGIPKMFADIEDLHIMEPHYTTTISYEGNTFLRMHFEAGGQITGSDLEAVKAQSRVMNTLGWRYIPKVGGPGADLSQFILYPQAMKVTSALGGAGTLTWIEQTPMQNPSQWWIINCLAMLPIKKGINAIMTEGMSTLHAMGARVIE